MPHILTEPLPEGETAPPAHDPEPGKQWVRDEFGWGQERIKPDRAEAEPETDVADSAVQEKNAIMHWAPVHAAESKRRRDVELRPGQLRAQRMGADRDWARDQAAAADAERRAQAARHTARSATSPVQWTRGGRAPRPSSRVSSCANRCNAPPSGDSDGPGDEGPGDDPDHAVAGRRESDLRHVSELLPGVLRRLVEQAGQVGLDAAGAR